VSSLAILSLVRQSVQEEGLDPGMELGISVTASARLYRAWRIVILLRSAGNKITMIITTASSNIALMKN